MRTRTQNSLAVLALSAAALLAAVIPASAQATSPWWQVQSSTRPVHMWEPQDTTEVQEVEGQKALGAIFAAKVEVGGDVIGCLGVGALGPSANQLCINNTGFGAAATAAELEAMLEGPYGAGQVEVSGGPIATAPLLVTTPGSWVLPITVTPLFSSGLAMGTASTAFKSEGSGRLVLTMTNLGTAPVDGDSETVEITNQLPEGFSAYGVEGVAGVQAFGGVGPVDCAVEASDLVSCTFEDELPSYESIEVEILVALTGPAESAGGGGMVTVTGGGAPKKSLPQDVEVSEEPVPFGFEHFSMASEEEGGAPSTQAGAHPLQVTTTLQLNTGRQVGIRPDVFAEQPGLPRNVRTTFPAGFAGSATAVPPCDLADFLEMTEYSSNKCSDQSVVGVASINFIEEGTLKFTRVALPLFSLTPGQGEPARFGFVVAGNPIVIYASVDPEDQYRIVGEVRNTTQVVQFLSATITLWGVPGDPRHDSARGWNCVYYAKDQVPGPCTSPTERDESPFLRMPTSCDRPLEYLTEVEPWNVPLGSVVDSALAEEDPLLGCSKVPFDPTITAAPTSKLAENSSGLDFELRLPNFGFANPTGISESQPKRIEVTLPEGVTINPSQAEGLAVCSFEDYGRERFNSSPGAGCPEASKIGNIEATTPLIEETLRGSLYVAKPYDNPFSSLLAVYIVARSVDRGVLVKQALEIKPDERTGRLVVVADNTPPIPYERFTLHFREGGRAPLVTPPRCGTFETIARFTPWSAQDPENPTPEEVVSRTASFEVSRGVDGGDCPPGGLPPFKPGLNAGTLNNNAGSFSPFTLRLHRTDGEQQFTHFSIKLPPGVTGKLAGVPFCPASAIEAAKAKTGKEELANPSCPAASEVGRTLVGAGVGSLLAYVPGKVYLAGPYNGSALSIMAITSAVAGPFDLGTVVVRQALRINPETAEVFIDATGSDPLPHIIKGVPTKLRDIRAYVDRPEFVLNPTSCDPTSTASTVLGSGLDFSSVLDDEPVTVSTRFQVANCLNLPFKPKLSFRLKGGTKRGKHPSLRAHLEMKGVGEAAIERASVTLPRSEFLENAHIRTICTRVQFREGAAPGEKCPADSIYGRVRAVTPILDEPLEGPIFLRSSEHELPDLVAALHSGRIDVALVGRIDSVKGGGIRNTFDFVPDAPVTSADFIFGGGSKSLLINSTDLCKGKHLVNVKLDGHNGKTSDYKTPLKAKCSKKGKRSGARR